MQRNLAVVMLGLGVLAFAQTPAELMNDTTVRCAMDAATRNEPRTLDMK